MSLLSLWFMLHVKHIDCDIYDAVMSSVAFTELVLLMLTAELLIA